MKAHPYAEKFPLMPEAELADLAESIRENGLRDPVVVTADGLILDGRNRAAACELAGVEPDTVVYEGDDLAEYVIDRNSSRRHMSTGARAMSTALILAEAGRRENGRWKRGSVVNPESGISDGKTWQNLLNQAGLVIDHRPELASEVINGHYSLNAAYEEAQAARTNAALREQEERQAAEAEEAAEQFLRAEAPELAEQVGTTYETHLEAEAVWRVRNAELAKQRAEEERAEREKQAAIAKGVKDALGHISNALAFLDGGVSEGEKFLAQYWPDHDKYLDPRRAITSERVDAAIDYLTTIRKAMP